MANNKTTGGLFVKSHKKRDPKTATAAPAAGPSTSVALQPTEPHQIASLSSSQNPLAAVLPVAVGGGGSQPPAPPVAAIETPGPLPAERQWWYRPADSKARKLVEKIVVMDVAGYKDADIAKKLKTTPASISQYRYLGKKNGWIRIGDDGDEEVVDLEAELAMNIDRKIVRNIDHALDGGMTNYQTHEMTIAAAKGRGIFKNDQSKNEGNASLPVVAIQVIMPTIGVSDQAVVEANVGGVAAYVEGDIEGK